MPPLSMQAILVKPPTKALNQMMTRLELFVEDEETGLTTPIDPDQIPVEGEEGGGPGGGGGSSTTIFTGASKTDDPLKTTVLSNNLGVGHRVPLGSFGFPRVDGGFDLNPADGTLEGPAAGGYIAQIKGEWKNVLEAAPGSYASVRLSWIYGDEYEHPIVEITQPGQGLSLKIDKTSLGLPPDYGYFALVADQTMTAEGDETGTPDLDIIVNIVKI